LTPVKGQKEGVQRKIPGEKKQKPPLGRGRAYQGTTANNASCSRGKKKTRVFLTADKLSGRKKVQEPGVAQDKKYWLRKGGERPIPELFD